MYHVIIYVPATHAEAIRTVLAESGAGRIGAYDSCTFSSSGIGRFRPLAGADPHLGIIGRIESVTEERIETVVSEPTTLQAVLHAVKRVHPYEEPAIHVLPMEDYRSFLPASADEADRSTHGAAGL